MVRFTSSDDDREVADDNPPGSDEDLIASEDADEDEYVRVVVAYFVSRTL